MAQLLSNLPVGAAVKFGMHQVGTETAQSIIWVVADKNHAGYPSNSVTLLAQKIIDLRAYDATESGFAVGNPNYALSNVHQWLNSSAASNWYTATHANDVAPTNSTTGRNTGYQSRAGFLYKFTSYERNAILPTSLKIITGSTTNNITANVFIPSVGEVLGTGNGSDGSSRFSYFSSRSVWTTLTTQAFNNTSSSYKPEDTSKTWDYWSRNASASKVTGISSTGITFDADAYNGSLGVRPALNLSATTKISDGTDGDGCYLVYENKMPTISGANTDNVLYVEY